MNKAISRPLVAQKSQTPIEHRISGEQRIVIQTKIWKKIKLNFLEVIFNNDTFYFPDLFWSFYVFQRKGNF